MVPINTASTNNRKADDSKVDGAEAFLVVLYGFQHPLDGFRIAAEGQVVRNVIGHSSSFPTPLASISLILLPNAEMTGTLTAFPAIL